MKKIKDRVFAFAIGLLCSCSSIDKNIEQTSVNNFKTKDTTISFTGYWLCKDYIESINNFKSPKKAQYNSKFIYIPDSTIKQTMMIGNFHEGGPIVTIMSYGKFRRTV